MGIHADSRISFFGRTLLILAAIGELSTAYTLLSWAILTVRSAGGKRRHLVDADGLCSENILAAQAEIVVPTVAIFDWFANLPVGF